LRHQPDNFHALALKTRLDALRHLISNDEAKGVIRGLIDEHPGDVYLEVAAAALVAQDGDRPGAIALLKATAEANGDDPYVHQVLAGLLGCDRATWDEALDHYKIALRTGPLLTPSYQSAAYYLAKRSEPALAPTALQGATPVDRAAIRTRSLGFNRMALVLAVLAVSSLSIDALGRDGEGVAVMVIATAWAGWAAVANYAVGCWKCAAWWLLTIVVAWSATVWATSVHSRGLIWEVTAGSTAVVVYQVIKNVWITPGARTKVP
jgi:tetratricopeptide (TPR) repeat protein